MKSDLTEFTLETGKKEELVQAESIALAHDCDSAYVVYAVRQKAETAGFTHIDAALIATAASELATNIIRYGRTGEIIFGILKDCDSQKTGIELFAVDNGPGIADIDAAMEERFTSLPGSLGLGLPSVKRIMDEFFIESIVGKGTRILTRKWKHNE